MPIIPDHTLSSALRTRTIPGFSHTGSPSPIRSDVTDEPTTDAGASVKMSCSGGVGGLGFLAAVWSAVATEKVKDVEGRGSVDEEKE